MPVDPRELRRAEEIFRDESAKSYALELGDLCLRQLVACARRLAISSRRCGPAGSKRSPTCAAATSPRTSASSIAAAGATSPSTRRRRSSPPAVRFYNEDELAAYDVLDYDIDIVAAPTPERQWLEGRTTLRMKVLLALDVAGVAAAGRFAHRALGRERPIRPAVQPARAEPEHRARQPAVHAAARRGVDADRRL